MIAASFWSLLAPAIELAEDSGYYGKDGKYAFVPVAVGFLFGALFVYATDKVITYLGINSASMMIQLTQSNKDKAEIAIDESALEHGKPMMQVGALNEHSLAIGMDSFADCLNNQHSGQTRKRNKKHKNAHEHATYESENDTELNDRLKQWKRIILLIAAVTIHNIPGKFKRGGFFPLVSNVHLNSQRVWLSVSALVQLDHHRRLLLKSQETLQLE